MQNPKVLITGGGGYLGLHTALFLYKSGYHPLLIDQKKLDMPPSWSTYIMSDFANEKELRDIFLTQNISAVIHCAQAKQYQNSILELYNTNVSKTIRLLELMIDHHISQFIFCSSADVYNNQDDNTNQEKSTVNPETTHGKTKKIIESILYDLNKNYDLNYINLRFSTISGALSPQLGFYNIDSSKSEISKLIHAFHTKEPYNIPGINYNTPDGTFIDDYIHIWDAAHAIQLSLDHLNKKLPSDTFNISSGQKTSIKQLINILSSLTKQEIKTIISEPIAYRTAKKIVDPTHAHTILGWEAAHSSIKQIIQSELQQYKYSVKSSAHNHIDLFFET